MTPNTFKRLNTIRVVGLFEKSQVSDGGHKNRRTKQKHQGDVTIRIILCLWIQNRLEVTSGSPYCFGLV